MGVYNEQSYNHPFARGIQGAPGVGFSLTADGNYDIVNKKLTNVGSPTASADAATKKYVDDNSSWSLTTSRLRVDSNIEMMIVIVFLIFQHHPMQMNQPQNNRQILTSFTEMQVIP